MPTKNVFQSGFLKVSNRSWRKYYTDDFQVIFEQARLLLACKILWLSSVPRHLLLRDHWHLFYIISEVFFFLMQRFSPRSPAVGAPACWHCTIIQAPRHPALEAIGACVQESHRAAGNRDSALKGLLQNLPSSET